MPEARPLLAETFARQLLNESSDLAVSKEGFVAAKTLVKALNPIAAKKRSNVWTVPEKLSPVQTFVRHILHFMSTYYKDEGVIKTCCSISIPQ